MSAAAFFDLDRTLISGTSAFPFGVEAWRQGMAKSNEILGWAVDAVFFLITGDKGTGASIDLRTEFLDRIKGAPYLLNPDYHLQYVSLHCDNPGVVNYC